MARELAHEMLPHPDNGERPSKTVRETEAEAVAFVVSQTVGLEPSVSRPSLREESPPPRRPR